MPKRGESELRRAVRSLARQFQPKQISGRAIMGDGFGNVEVASRPGYVNVRTAGDPSQVSQVFAKGWNSAEGTPVIVGETPQQPGFMQVLDIDWGAFSQQRAWTFSGTSYLPKHGFTHRWGNDDVTYVESSQFMPLAMQETIPPSMQTFVYQGYYPVGQGMYHWLGGFGPDLTYLRPSGSLQERFVSFYMDPATTNLSAVTGTVLGGLSTPWWSYAPATPSGTVPIACVELLGSDTSIRFDKIHDLRTFFPSFATHGHMWETFFFTLSGALSTGAKPLRTYVPGPYTINGVFISANTPPTDASIIVDVEKNGTTIFTTQSKRPMISGTVYTGQSGVPDLTGLVLNDYLTFSIDQVGSGTVGSDLTVHVRCIQETWF